MGDMMNNIEDMYDLEDGINLREELLKLKKQKNGINMKELITLPIKRWNNFLKELNYLKENCFTLDEMELYKFGWSLQKIKETRNN